MKAYPQEGGFQDSSTSGMVFPVIGTYHLLLGYKKAASISCRVLETVLKNVLKTVTNNTNENFILVLGFLLDGLWLSEGVLKSLMKHFHFKYYVKLPHFSFQPGTPDYNKQLIPH